MNGGLTYLFPSTLLLDVCQSYGKHRARKRNKLSALHTTSGTLWFSSQHCGHSRLAPVPVSAGTSGWRAAPPWGYALGALGQQKGSGALRSCVSTRHFPLRASLWCAAARAPGRLGPAQRRGHKSAARTSLSLYQPPLCIKPKDADLQRSSLAKGSDEWQTGSRPGILMAG